MVCDYLDTPDLARFDIVKSVHANVWKKAVQRRCGPLWPSGRTGLYYLYCAVQCFPRQLTYATANVCAGRHSVWIGNTCASIIDEKHVAVANEYGIAIQDTQTYRQVQLWQGEKVVSIAYLGDCTILFCTGSGKAFTYCNDLIFPTHTEEYVLTVSGPVEVLGTMRGTWPMNSIQSPCVAIAQSAILVATYHVIGTVCVFGAQDMQHLYHFDTGPCTKYTTLSTIADIICIAGVTWRNGHKYGTCPIAVRACSNDGMHTVASFT